MKKDFNSLVENAIDFLRRSTSEIDTNPKYAVINFFSALELFLKARLMLEHWALIVSKPEHAQKEKFQSGDFVSISFDEAVSRLKSIAGVEVKQEERECFTTIRKHRNQLVHFFHSEYTGTPPSHTTLLKVVSELSKGWFYLYRLLTSTWQEYFLPYKDELDPLAQLMEKHRHYLIAKYDALKPDIDAGKAKGLMFVVCPSCYTAAAQKTINFRIVARRDCRVCGLVSTYLRVPCPDCGIDIVIEDMGEGNCDECGKDIDLDYLLEEYGQPARSKDDIDDYNLAYCTSCEYLDRKTVIPIDMDKLNWLCLTCQEIHLSVDDCDYCGTLVAGKEENTYLNGCVVCFGGGWSNY